jgi:NAD(P)-dependent dehydrogenase (short-subunit alcohol dehydrogenase family)
VKTLESKETKASKEITVTHNSVFAAHRLQCRMTTREDRHPAFCFASDRDSALLSAVWLELISDVKSALNKTIGAFGRLDFAFNNAGIEQPVMATGEITEQEWDRIVAVNLRGVFLCMKHEIPLMLKQGGGAIVNTSSGAGVKGFKGQAAYAAAKHGVIGLTKSAALDYAAQNIRINAVCPGIISTAMMDRFTGGTAEGRERVISQAPVGRMG